MIDSHCHLAGDEFAADLAEVVARAKQAGLSAALCILAAGDQPKRRPSRACRRSGRRCASRSAFTRTRPEPMPDDIPAAVLMVKADVAARRARRHRRNRPRLSLRLLAARRPAGRFCRPGRPRVRAGPAGRHSHPRGHGRHVHGSCAPRQGFAACSTASPAIGPWPARRSTSGSHSRSPVSSRFPKAAELREVAAHRAGRSHPGRNRLPVSRAHSVPGAAQRAGAGRARRRDAGGDPRRASARRWPSSSPATSTPCSAPSDPCNPS